MPADSLATCPPCTPFPKGCQSSVKGLCFVRIGPRQRKRRHVTFVDADHGIDDEIEAAYRTKYGRYAGSILNSVLTPEARSATIKLVPCSARS